MPEADKEGETYQADTPQARRASSSKVRTSSTGA
jgi:hypothetical protein